MPRVYAGDVHARWVPLLHIRVLMRFAKLQCLQACLVLELGQQFQKVSRCHHAGQFHKLQF
jgi:hypothetical protein